MKTLDLTKLEGRELSHQVYILRQRVAHNEISYNQGKELAEPYIQELNRRSKEIAKEFGMKPKTYKFAGFGTPR